MGLYHKAKWLCDVSLIEARLFLKFRSSRIAKRSFIKKEGIHTRDMSLHMSQNLINPSVTQYYDSGFRHADKCFLPPSEHMYIQARFHAWYIAQI